MELLVPESYLPVTKKFLIRINAQLTINLWTAEIFLELKMAVKPLV